MGRKFWTLGRKFRPPEVLGKISGPKFRSMSRELPRTSGVIRGVRKFRGKYRNFRPAQEKTSLTVGFVGELFRACLATPWLPASRQSSSEQRQTHQLCVARSTKLDVFHVQISEHPFRQSTEQSNAEQCLITEKCHRQVIHVRSFPSFLFLSSRSEERL